MLEEIVCQHGFSKASFYKWKAKYSSMSASDLKRLKEMEEKNRRLKQLYANLRLEHAVLKDIIEKKTLKPEEQRELIKYAIAEHDLRAGKPPVLVVCSQSDPHVVFRHEPSSKGMYTSGFFAGNTNLHWNGNRV